LTAYLNSQLELSGPLTVLAMAPGQTSLGMRHNQVNFFEGAIAKVRFTPSVVEPVNFLSVVLGDYDRNGIVEHADYVLWKSTFGNTVSAPGYGADGNFDGLINAADYTVWRDHLLPGSTAALSHSVPEPVAMLLIASAIIGLSGQHSRRRPRGSRRTH
jgi:hypothetical protein